MQGADEFKGGSPKQGCSHNYLFVVCLFLYFINLFKYSQESDAGVSQRVLLLSAIFLSHPTAEGPSLVFLGVLGAVPVPARVPML